MKVFAYGSNLSRKRLGARARSASFLGKARLERHSLRFHKRSRDGSGKADAYHTDDPKDVVWGAVFECDATDKAALDKAEGLGQGYNERTVCVELGDGTLDAIAYLADPKAIEQSLRPYTWYLEHVLIGAQEQGLPEDYANDIRNISADPDPDRSRERKEMSIHGNRPTDGA